VIVHETDTGYAQSFLEDIQNEQMGPLSLEQIEFSEQVRAEWTDSEMFTKLKQGLPFHNPAVDLQVQP